MPRLIIRHQANRSRVVKPANNWHTRFWSLWVLLARRGSLRDDSPLVGWILAAVRTPSCTRPSLPAVASAQRRTLERCKMAQQRR
jgi:hypothetical protein